MKLINLLNLLNLLNLVLSIQNIPQIGKIYSKKISLPIVGNQYIETKIITNNSAKIKLEGIINKKGTVKYYNDFFIFSPNIKKIIKLYDIEISNFEYSYEHILFYLYIKKLKYNKKILLKKN